MAGRFWQWKVEQRRQALGDLEAVLAERRERAGNAAELQRWCLLAQPSQPLARACERGRVARDLEAERDRQRLLQADATDCGSAAMAAGDLGEAFDGAVEVAGEQVDCVAQLQRERGV